MPELYLQITLDDNGSVAKVQNLGQAIAKIGSESEGAFGKVDKLSGSLDKSESSTSSLIGTLKGLGIAYAALRIERTIEGWMKLSIAQDQADRTLKAAMISNGRYSEMFYQGTLRQAEALRQLTGEDKATIEASQRMLMSFSAISNDAMPQATKAVLNLSVLMGQEGGGLRGATLALGKAMEGSAEGLKRYGIVLNENVFKQRGAAGVLEEVSKKVEGQAEELTKGSGQWNVLGAMLDEVRKKAGDFFNEMLVGSGGLDKVLGIIDQLLAKFDELKNSGQLEEWALTMATGVVRAFELMTNAASIFLTMMNKIAQGYGYIGGGAEVVFGKITAHEERGQLEATQTNLKNLEEQKTALSQQLLIYSSKGGATPEQFRDLQIEEFRITHDIEFAKASIKLIQQDLLQSKDIIASGFRDIISADETGRAIKTAQEGFDNLRKKAEELGESIKQNIGHAQWRYIGESFKTVQDLGLGGYASGLTGQILNSTASPIWQTPNPIVGPSEADLKAQEAAAKKYAEALQDVNDIIAKNTLTDYGFQVYELDQKYKKLAESIGGTNKALERAHALELAGLKTGIGEEYWKNISEIDKISAKIIADDDKRWDDFFKNQVKLEEDATKAWNEYTDNFIVNILNQKENLDDLIKKWGELAKKVDEARISIAEHTIKDRSGWDTFFPSEETIHAFETKSKLAIQKINNELNKNLSVSGITGEQKSIFSQDAANKIADINKKLTGEMYSGWKELSDAIAGDFSSAFESILADGTGTFKKLADALRHSFAHILSGVVEQDILKPFMNQMMAGMQGNLVPYGTTAALGQTVAPAWMGNYGNQIMGGIGAGAMGYGVGQAMGQSGIGSGLGAGVGFLAGGPAGALAGGLVGTMVEGFLGIFKEKAEIEIPKINTIWEVVNGQVAKVKSTWEHVGDAQVKDIEISITEALNTQLEFYNKIAAVAGLAAPSFTSILHQTGNINPASVPIQAQIGTNISQYGTLANLFGEEFVKKFGVAWNSTYNQEWFIHRVGGIGTLYNDEISKLETILNDVSYTLADFGNSAWLDPTSTFSPQAAANLPKYETPEEKIALLNQLMGDTLTEGQQKQWQDLFDTLNEKLQNFQTSFSQTIGQAFLDSIGTAEFSNFENAIKKVMSQQILSSFSQVFSSDMIKPVTTAFLPGFSMVEKYISDTLQNKETVSIGDIASSFSSGINQLAPIFQAMEPIWKQISDIMVQLNQTLGVNTAATQSNTDAVLGPVNSFLMSLDTGPLAPSQSIAGLMGAQSKLYTAAFANPESFSEYANYMTSTYLPGMQGLSGNYEGVVSGVKGQVNALPWYNQGGGTSLQANDIGTAVAAAVAPMLLDIKEAAKITVQIIVDGKEIKSAVVSSLNDPNVVNKMRSRM